MKIILVSEFRPIPYEQELVVLLFNYGLEIFHLRKNNYSEDDMRSYLNNIPKQYHSRIVMHSHFNLIDEYGLMGAHFTKKIPIESIENEINISELKHISFSVHSLSEIQEINRRYDYLFISPVFNSISNVGYNSKIKISSFKKYLSTVIDRPEIIALGGINDSKIEQLYSAKFNGFGMLGYIWNSFERDGDMIAALNRFRVIKSKRDSLVNLVDIVK